MTPDMAEAADQLCDDKISYADACRIYLERRFPRAAANKDRHRPRPAGEAAERALRRALVGPQAPRARIGDAPADSVRGAEPQEFQSALLTRASFKRWVDSGTRKIIERLVSRRALTPEQANEVARKLDLEPFEIEPPADAYDPMNEPNWTLPMVVIWIAERTPSAVRKHYPQFYSSRKRWVENPYSRRVYLGFTEPEIDTTRPEILTAIDKLRDALLHGDVVASAGAETIPKEAWQDVDLWSTIKRGDRTVLALGRKWQYPTILRKSVLEAWNQQKGTEADRTGGAQETVPAKKKRSGGRPAERDWVGATIEMARYVIFEKAEPTRVELNGVVTKWFEDKSAEDTQDEREIPDEREIRKLVRRFYDMLSDDKGK